MGPGDPRQVGEGGVGDARLEEQSAESGSCRSRRPPRPPRDSPCRPTRSRGCHSRRRLRATRRSCRHAIGEAERPMSGGQDGGTPSRDPHSVRGRGRRRRGRPFRGRNSANCPYLRLRVLCRAGPQLDGPPPSWPAGPEPRLGADERVGRPRCRGRWRAYSGSPSAQVGPVHRQVAARDHASGARIRPAMRSAVAGSIAAGGFEFAAPRDSLPANPVCRRGCARTRPSRKARTAARVPWYLIRPWILGRGPAVSRSTAFRADRDLIRETSPLRVPAARRWRNSAVIACSRAFPQLQGGLRVGPVPGVV